MWLQPWLVSPGFTRYPDLSGTCSARPARSAHWPKFGAESRALGPRYAGDDCGGAPPPLTKSLTASRSELAKYARQFRGLTISSAAKIMVLRTSAGLSGLPPGPFPLAPSVLQLEK